MALIPWEPFREMEMLQRDMNRLFDRMMSELLVMRGALTSSPVDLLYPGCRNARNA